MSPVKRETCATCPAPLDHRGMYEAVPLTLMCEDCASAWGKRDLITKTHSLKEGVTPTALDTLQLVYHVFVALMAGYRWSALRAHVCTAIHAGRNCGSLQHCKTALSSNFALQLCSGGGGRSAQLNAESASVCATRRPEQRLVYRLHGGKALCAERRGDLQAAYFFAGYVGILLVHCGCASTQQDVSARRSAP
eukprot:TRINITY_DN13274_c0_g4_i1.p1 TRINITY_DN13274_c0_g4~~TRINITY_DN13274_c0_g4_i1.p1  ORF type:complete len:193 (+),score=9.23 TRINITY_DN13274_c0_g4_i1:189-767(+)